MKKFILIVVLLMVALPVTSFAEGGIDIVTYMVRYYSRLDVMEEALGIDVELTVIDPIIAVKSLYNFDVVTVSIDDNNVIKSAMIGITVPLPNIIAFMYGLRDAVTFDSVDVKYGLGWTGTYESDLEVLSRSTMDKPFVFGDYSGFVTDGCYFFVLSESL